MATKRADLLNVLNNVLHPLSRMSCHCEQTSHQMNEKPLKIHFLLVTTTMSSSRSNACKIGQFAFPNAKTSYLYSVLIPHAEKPRIKLYEHVSVRPLMLNKLLKFEYTRCPPKMSTY